MSSNRHIREKMIQLYGAECFIEKLHLRKDKQQKYTGKCQYCRMKQLTYHHIKMKSKGGRATIENGALLSSENHSWFHLQSKQAQKEMNEAFQEYKRQVDEARKQGKEIPIVLSDEVHVPFEIKPIIFTPYNRAKRKADTRKAVDEYEKGEER